MTVVGQAVTKLVVLPTPSLLRWRPCIFPICQGSMTVEARSQVFLLSVKFMMLGMMRDMLFHCRVMPLMPFTSMMPRTAKAHIPMSTMVHMMRGVGGVGHMYHSFSHAVCNGFWWMPLPSRTSFLLMRATPGLLLRFPNMLPMLRLFSAVKPLQAWFTAKVFVLAAPDLLWRSPMKLEVHQVQVTLISSARFLLVLAAQFLLARIPFDLPLCEINVAVKLRDPMHHSSLYVLRDLVMCFSVPKNIATGHLHSALPTMVAFTSNQVMSRHTSMLLVGKSV